MGVSRIARSRDFMSDLMDTYHEQNPCVSYIKRHANKAINNFTKIKELKINIF